MTFTPEDFHYISFHPSNRKFWEVVADRANEKLAEKQKATPDPRVEVELKMLKHVKEMAGLLFEVSEFIDQLPCGWRTGLITEGSCPGCVLKNRIDSVIGVKDVDSKTPPLEKAEEIPGNRNLQP